MKQTKKLTYNESNLIACVLIKKMKYSKKELFSNNGEGFNQLLNDDFVRFSICYHVNKLSDEIVKEYGT